MPRVMTYGFAPEPAGLGMHRIWVAVPEQNSRSCSVYQSLGFEPSGASRDALWDAENNKYQDLIVMDTLVDEYDPIRSLDAFGMHVIEDNPGVQEAMSAREHSIAIRKNIAAQAEPPRSRRVRMPNRRPESRKSPQPECRKRTMTMNWPRRAREAPGRMGRANANLRRKLGGVSSDVAVNVIWRMTNECRGS